MKENEDQENPIRQRIRNSNKHKRDGKGMMCRMSGYPNTHKFLDQWVPLIDAASDAYIMDWGNILSDSITSQILDYRTIVVLLEYCAPILHECLYNECCPFYF